MGRGDEIDVVTSLLLKAQHYTGQFPGGYLPAIGVMADVEILTKQTPQIAEGKENRSGTMGSHQGSFLAEMGTMTGDPCLPAGPAISMASVPPVHATPPGTQPAFPQRLQGRADARGEDAFPPSAQVSGFGTR